MSTQCSGSSAALEKAEVHTESIQQPVQPLDLAPRGSQVVQLRPVRAYTPQLAKSVGGPTAVGGLTAVNAPIISIARVGNMRSATLTPGQQPASITVTPISASNFGANIRLASATVSNGSWIQTPGGAQGTFTTPIRAAAITVGPRHVRPEQTKMIHLPQQGSVPQITQLQMVDPKSSILKPSITTPIVNIRGSLQGGGNTAAQVLPIAPFTIRTTNLANIPTIQQRPPTSTSSPVNQVQKVIAQPTHGPPIQFVPSNKIQAITPLPRLSVNALLLSTNANLAPNSSSPVVAVASKQGTAGLIMTPALTTGTGTSGMPLAKVIPVGRDGSSSIVDSLFAQSNASTSSAVTVSAVSGAGTQVSNSGQNLSSTNVIIASPSTSQGATNSSGSTQTQSHQLIHVQGPINVHHTSPATATVGLPPNISSSNLTPSYYLEKNGGLSLVQTPQSRPITLEKRTSDGKSIPTGSMILTTQHPHLQSGNPGQTATVTIPIGAHGAQNVSFAHPITMTPSGGQHHQIPSSAQIITTPISAHHIASTVLSTMSTAPTISVSAPSSQSTNAPPPGQSTPSHSIPTHVISQPSGTVSFTSASTTLSNVTVTTTVASSTVAVTNTSTISSNAISVSVSLTSSNSTMTSSTTSTTSTTSNSGSLSTAAPAQSPNTKSTTHSPRPSILRKQREISDNHISARAQRNLTLQLNFAGNNTNSTPSVPPPVSSVSASSVPVTGVTSANKENAGAMERGPPPPPVSTSNSSTATTTTTTNNITNNTNNNNNSGSNNNNNNNNSSGLSILRKEFQPPNEESSWQSCSSHSSGSTTISATSETAEYQLNQPSSTSTLEVNATPNCENASSNSVLPVNTTTPMSQNGVVRSITSGSHGKGHRNSSSKLQNKNIERLKQDKEDCVSPRKKPRKQQLTSSDFLEAVSPEISFYQGRGKKFKRMENNIFDGYSNSKPGADAQAEDGDPPKMICFIKKPRISLLSSTQIQLGKTRHNHFEHYSEVKAKEERRPTISDLANQKNILNKVSGWKIQHMTNQMEQVVELEVSVVNSFNSLLTRLESKVGPNCPDRDINRILELLKGNIQRCKVIRDQMSDSRVQALKILDHKPRIVEVITKHMAKKPTKKKDRL